MAREIYFGFSSRNVQSGFNTVCKGIRLVNEDLRNHFDTDPYERVGRQDHFCLISHLHFGKDDPGRRLIALEAERVIRADPRVELRSLKVTNEEHAITVEAKLYYRQYDMEDLFIHTFRITQ